jgi:hypothetical protein
VRMARARLLCRDLRHPWALGPTYLVQRDLVERNLKCPRCGTERVEVVVRHSGEVVARSYHYADGYQQDAGEGRLLAPDARVELLRTVTVKPFPAARLHDLPKKIREAG